MMNYLNEPLVIRRKMKIDYKWIKQRSPLYWVSATVPISLELFAIFKYRSGLMFWLLTLASFIIFILLLFFIRWYEPKYYERHYGKDDE